MIFYIKQYKHIVEVFELEAENKEEAQVVARAIAAGDETAWDADAVPEIPCPRRLNDIVNSWIEISDESGLDASAESIAE